MQCTGRHLLADCITYSEQSCQILLGSVQSGQACKATVQIRVTIKSSQVLICVGSSDILRRYFTVLQRAWFLQPIDVRIIANVALFLNLLWDDEFQ